MPSDETILDTLFASVLHKQDSRDRAWDSNFEHRIQLCRSWGIDDKAALKVIDVGCGQADSTAVLAYLVGSNGHVTGLDPAPPTYGAPLTLGQAQDYLKQSALGPRVSFVENNLPDFLASGTAPHFDAAVFCHSLWYFDGRGMIDEHFAAVARAGVSRIYLAEYTFAGGSAEQRPHQLAARAQILLHKHKRPGTQKTKLGELNVREALEFDELLAVAAGSGWTPAKRGVVTPSPDLKDGYWETVIVAHEAFREGVLAQKLAEEDENRLLDYIPQVQKAKEELEAAGKPIATMDVAWAVLELRQEQ
ncbi:hypothetical protein PWT90_04122 [Aphanocladium album]|nr:hypothetical protein PWT90_04122 [Aphanocladium album]